MLVWWLPEVLNLTTHNGEQTMTYTLARTQPAVNDLPRGLVIRTKYLGPTDHKGSRVAATLDRGGDCKFRAVISWDHACNSLENHYQAALAVLRRLEADSVLHFTIQAIGSEDAGYVFVTQAHDPAN